MKKIALIIIFILLNTVNCFAENYTIEELKEGQQKIYDTKKDLWNELDLQYVTITKNGLAVGAPELTEGEQIAVIEAAGIKNITFRIVQVDYHRSIIPKIRFIATKQPDNNVDMKCRVILLKIEEKNANYRYTKEKDIPIVMKQKPYQKEDGMIMVPLKESIDITSGYYEWIQKEYNNISREKYKTILRTDFKEFENYKNSVEKAEFKKDNQKATITFNGNTIVFYEGKKDILVNGVKKTLYCLPDIQQNDVFLYVKDIDILFESYVTEIIYGKSTYYSFEQEQGNVKMKENKEKTAAVRISINSEDSENGNIFFYKGGGYEYPIDVYNKNNHMMRAVKNLDNFIDNLVLDIKLEIKWNSESNTATLKFWDSIDKNVIFTKDSNKMIMNGVEIEMEEIAEIKNDKMYIPITALFEILEIPQNNIEWLDSKTVKITY